MSPKKILITATVLSHIAQFHRPLAEMLHAHGFEVHVAGKDNLASKNGLKIDWADKIYNVPFSRSPKSLDNIKAYLNVVCKRGLETQLTNHAQPTYCIVIESENSDALIQIAKFDKYFKSISSRSYAL